MTNEETGIDENRIEESRGDRGWSDRLAAWAIGVAAAALAGLVLVQGWQVFARYVLNDSSSWIEPATVALLTTAMSFGAAAGVHGDRHFAFTVLAKAASPRVRRALALIAKLVLAAVGATISIWAAWLFVEGMDVPAAGAPLPETLPYAPVAVGGALMTLFALVRAARIATGREAS